MYLSILCILSLNCHIIVRSGIQIIAHMSVRSLLRPLTIDENDPLLKRDTLNVSTVYYDQ